MAGVMTRRLTREIDKLKPGDEVDLHVVRQRSDEIGQGEDRVARFALRVDGAPHLGGPGDARAPTRHHRQPPRHDRRVRDRPSTTPVRPRKPGSKREAASRRSTASTCAATRRRRRRNRVHERRTCRDSSAKCRSSKPATTRPARLLQRSVPERQDEGGPRGRSAASQPRDHDHRRRQRVSSVGDASPRAAAIEINGEEIGDKVRRALEGARIATNAAVGGALGGFGRGFDVRQPRAW